MFDRIRRVIQSWRSLPTSGRIISLIVSLIGITLGLFLAKKILLGVWYGSSMLIAWLWLMIEAAGDGMSRSIGDAYSYLSSITVVVLSLIVIATVVVILSRKSGKKTDSQSIGKKVVTFAFTSLVILLGAGVALGILALVGYGIFYGWWAIGDLAMTLANDAWNSSVWTIDALTWGGEHPEFGQYIRMCLLLILLVTVLWNLPRIIKLSYKNFEFRKKDAGKQSKKKDKKASDDKTAMYLKKNWRPHIFVVVPKGYTAVITILGRAYRRYFRWGFKLPFLEDIIFIPTRNFFLEDSTQLINTAGGERFVIDREVKGVYTDKAPQYPTGEKADTETRGAQANYRAHVNVYVDDAILLFEQDPGLFNELLEEEVDPASEDKEKAGRKLLRKFVFGTLSGTLKDGQPRLLMQQAYLLPGVILLAAENGDDIVGDTPKKGDSESARWGRFLDKRKVKVALDPKKPKELMATSLRNIDLGNKSHLMAIANTWPRSPLGRLRAMGLGIAKFELIDFEPVKEALDLFREKTLALMRRENNLIQIQQNQDDAHSDRVIREQKAIGSGRTVTAQLEVIRNWVFEATGGQYERDTEGNLVLDTNGRQKMIPQEGVVAIWNPSEQYLERITPAYEFMRRFQNSSNSTIFMGLSEIIPELGKVLKQVGAITA